MTMRASVDVGRQRRFFICFAAARTASRPKMGLREIIVGREADEFVFVTVRGAAVDTGNWYYRVWLKARRAVQSASGYSVHDLRHVAATNAIAAGADVKLVQLMLGHKDATETLNTYSHLWPNRVEEVIDAVERRRTEALGLGQLRAI